jgi:hypothetical protein
MFSLEFISSNTTSLVQLVDMGVLKNVKTCVAQS